jgi:hypothetical protein
MSSEAARKAWATRRARRSKASPLKQIQTLADEQTRWLRKETIARNKLKRIRYRIEHAEEFILADHQRNGPADTVWAKRKFTK